MFGKNSGLSLDQAPPLRIPLKFFVTAPIFGIIAGLFVLGFVSSLGARSALEVITLTHLFTIGFLAMVMIGAMFQMLPVIAGVKFKYQNILAPLVHSLLSAGLIVFAYGIYTYTSIAMIVAMVLMVFAFLMFIFSTLFALTKTQNVTPTIKAFIVALLSLFIAILLAMYITISHATADISISHQALLNTHILFSLVGWVGMLIVGVSFQVIPMFYVTEPYPEFYKKHAIKIIFVSMLGLAFGLITDSYQLYLLFKVIISLMFLDYGITTISRLLTRKRKISDTTIHYWYLAISMLITAILLSLANEYFNNYLLNTVIVVIFIYGFAMSIMTGMLYKVVPFLVWFHLTNQGYMNMPTMNDLIGKKLTITQFYLHIASLASLIGLVFISEIQIIAGIVVVLSNGFILYNLIKGSKLYFTKQGLEKMNF